MTSTALVGGAALVGRQQGVEGAHTQLLHASESHLLQILVSLLHNSQMLAQASAAAAVAAASAAGVQHGDRCHLWQHCV